MGRRGKERGESEDEPFVRMLPVLSPVAAACLLFLSFVRGLLESRVGILAAS